MITREHLTYFHIRLDGCRSYQYFLTKKDHEALLHCSSLWNGISWFSCCSSRTEHQCQQPIENILLYNSLFPLEQSFHFHRKMSFSQASILRIQWIWLKQIFISIVEYLAQTEFEFTHAKMLLQCKLVERWKIILYHYCATVQTLANGTWWPFCELNSSNAFKRFHQRTTNTSAETKLLKRPRKSIMKTRVNILMALFPPFTRCLTITSCLSIVVSIIKFH